MKVIKYGIPITKPWSKEMYAHNDEVLREVVEEVKERVDRVKEEIADVKKAAKEVASQVGDVADAAKGKKRRGRPKKKK